MFISKVARNKTGHPRNNLWKSLEMLKLRPKGPKVIDKDTKRVMKMLAKKNIKII